MQAVGPRFYVRRYRDVRLTGLMEKDNKRGVARL